MAEGEGKGIKATDGKDLMLQALSVLKVDTKSQRYKNAVRRARQSEKKTAGFTDEGSGEPIRVYIQGKAELIVPDDSRPKSR